MPSNKIRVFAVCIQFLRIRLLPCASITQLFRYHHYNSEWCTYFVSFYVTILSNSAFFLLSSNDRLPIYTTSNRGEIGKVNAKTKRGVTRDEWQQNKFDIWWHFLSSQRIDNEAAVGRDKSWPYSTAKFLFLLIPWDSVAAKLKDNVANFDDLVNINHTI